MSTSVGNIVNIWQYPFSLLYSLLRVRVCKFWYHWADLSNDNGPACSKRSVADMDPLEKIEKRKWIFPDSDSGTKTCRPEHLAGNNDSRSHSYRPIIIYLDNKTARGQSVTLSYISWRSVLLVEETGGSRENHQPVASHCVVCSSTIYGFWLPLWYLQTLLYTLLNTSWYIVNKIYSVRNKHTLCFMC
jgi:hypothetical protein